MNGEESRSNERCSFECEREEDARIIHILEEYLSAIEAGQSAEPSRLLAEHPALADKLRAYLQVMQMASRLGVDPGAHRSSHITPAATDGSATPQECHSLTTLDFGPGAPPHVLLRELPDEPEPLLKPRSAAMPSNGTGIGRFQLQGEIARGGMGVVLKGRDVDLGRELAIKVLLEAHQGNPKVVRRFVEEAQIGGQLQHPGVVPVYELGTFPDRRPFFAMKLVKGRTLASLLQERMKDEGGRTSGRMKDEGGRMNGETTAADESDSSFILHPSLPTSLASSPSSRRSARRWPTPTPAA
jgi:hypothetical protein